MQSSSYFRKDVLPQGPIFTAVHILPAVDIKIALNTELSVKCRLFPLLQMTSSSIQKKKIVILKCPRMGQRNWYVTLGRVRCPSFRQVWQGMYMPGFSFKIHEKMKSVENMEICPEEAIVPLELNSETSHADHAWLCCLQWKMYAVHSLEIYRIHEVQISCLRKMWFLHYWVFESWQKKSWTSTRNFQTGGEL